MSITQRSNVGRQRAERIGASRLYLCTDARVVRGDLLDFVAAAVRGGVDIVQVRDKTLNAAEERRVLDAVREVCVREGALLAVNDRADLAFLVGADVFHSGQGDLSVADSRRLLGPDVILGRSTHSRDQAMAADADPNVDYFCVGPVWATPTKPSRAAVGVGLVEWVAKQRPGTPWFAIGDINPRTVPEVAAVGATRVVAVRAVTESSDPRAAAATLRAALTNSLTVEVQG
ncbi:thiamine phosphate synthase [Klugiella xanthotipulae]|uniref:Thiamine-phosphate synthase n=1 Tax=Klugiella xanthotipulae TaxID=244735 RepID=A0A543HSY9_9MICO|nr:thiamine phosphate synthase [Klugiella xanthotipulae]TQM61453.1 thiamine-phosphate diphosphorylase [Klugiella xanthotipulae]